MRILDTPLTAQEIRNELDMVEGNIARIRLSSDAAQVVKHLGFAIERLSMIAYSRVKEMGGQMDAERG